MKHYNVRGRLLDSAIWVIAEEGLDRATTKAIAKGADVYETYIYQHFSSKDGLLAQMFDKLDEELVAVAMRHIPRGDGAGMDSRERYRAYFSQVWKFLLGNSSKCLAFIQYYYSPYFRKYSAQTHKERYRPLVETIGTAFKPEANVWMLLNHILTTMLDFAVKVFDGAVANDADTEEHIFRVIYSAVMPYFQ